MKHLRHKIRELSLLRVAVSRWRLEMELLAKEQEVEKARSDLVVYKFTLLRLGKKCFQILKDHRLESKKERNR